MIQRSIQYDVDREFFYNTSFFPPFVLINKDRVLILLFLSLTDFLLINLDS